MPKKQQKKQHIYSKAALAAAEAVFNKKYKPGYSCVELSRSLQEQITCAEAAAVVKEYAKLFKPDNTPPQCIAWLNVDAQLFGDSDSDHQKIEKEREEFRITALCLFSEMAKDFTEE